MKKLTVTLSFTVDRASKEVCDKFSQPYGTFELIDPDGIRWGFYPNEQGAKDAIHDAMANNFSCFDIIEED